METVKTRKIAPERVSFRIKRPYRNPRLVSGSMLPHPKAAYGAKRIIDIVLAAVSVLLLLSWITPLLWILIRLDSRGAAFFIQKRVGQNGRLFSCYKFRTMHPNPQADLLQVISNDKRITRVGRVLRRFHIDELPQLVNVLKGEMSLVGPRPHMPADEEIFEALVPLYPVRQKVKPGLTGLAQVKGYFGPTPDFHSVYFRTRLDHFYVTKVSLLLDIRILVATIRNTFSK